MQLLVEQQTQKAKKRHRRRISRDESGVTWDSGSATSLTLSDGEEKPEVNSEVNTEDEAEEGGGGAGSEGDDDGNPEKTEGNFLANEDKKYTAVFRAKFWRFFSAMFQFRLGQMFLGQVRLGQFSQVRFKNQGYNRYPKIAVYFLSLFTNFFSSFKSRIEYQ